MKNIEKWNEYQNNYRKDHYKQLSAHLDPTLVNDLRRELKKNHTTYSDFLRKCINEYLERK